MAHVASVVNQGHGLYTCKECEIELPSTDIDKHVFTKHKAGLVRIFVSEKRFEEWSAGTN